VQQYVRLLQIGSTNITTFIKFHGLYFVLEIFIEFAIATQYKASKEELVLRKAINSMVPFSPKFLNHSILYVNTAYGIKL